MQADKFQSMVYGLTAAAALGFLAWVGMSVNSMSERLTTIEVTMREGREERIAQIADLRNRVGRLEDREQIKRIPQ